MKRYLFVFLAVIIPLGVVWAARAIETHKGEIPRGYNFLLSPPDSVNEPKPLIIFLHGASLCGTNIERVKRYGAIDALERGRQIDAYVAAPQNPGGGWQPRKVMEVADWVTAHHNVDTTRIYVIGMSLGGYGTTDVAASYPDRIAAAVAICGGATTNKLANLNQMPFWLIHGTGDRAVPVTQSDNIVTAMKIDDIDTPRLVYDRVPGMNHSEPARIFYLPELYEWLLMHSLDEEDRPLHEPTHIDSALLSKAYAGLKSKGGTAKKTKRTARKRSRRRK